MATVYTFTHESGDFSEYDGNESPPASVVTGIAAHDGTYGLRMDCAGVSTFMGNYKTLSSPSCYWGGYVYIADDMEMDQYDEMSVMNFNDGAFGMVLNLRRMAAGRGSPDTWDLGEADRFTTGMLIGEWMYCEFHLSVNSATGLKECWVDGSSVFSASRDYTASTNLTQYGCMNGSPTGTATGYVYMDTCGISYTERVEEALPSSYSCIGAGTFTMSGHGDALTPSQPTGYPRRGLVHFRRAPYPRDFRPAVFGTMACYCSDRIQSIVELEWFDRPAASVSSEITTYSCVGDGTFTLSGSALWAVSDSYIGSGTFAFSGAATCSYNADKYYTGTGTLAFSGAATTTVIESYTGSGTLAFSGTALTSVVDSYTGSGQITFGGAAVAGVAMSYTGSGTLAFSGDAVCDYNADKSYDGSGTFTLSGSADTSVVESYVGSGQITFSGTAGTSVVESYTGSGQITFSGSAETSVAQSYTGTGTLTFSGAADASYNADKSYVGTGTFTLSGTAGATLAYNYNGSGQITFGGTASTSGSIGYIGGGTFNLSGTAGATLGYQYTGTGTFTLSGSAQCAIQSTTFGMITIDENWIPCTECQIVVSGAWHTVSQIQVVMSETWRNLV